MKRQCRLCLFNCSHCAIEPLPSSLQITRPDMKTWKLNPYMRLSFCNQTIPVSSHTAGSAYYLWWQHQPCEQSCQDHPKRWSHGAPGHPLSVRQGLLVLDRHCQKEHGHLVGVLFMSCIFPNCSVKEYFPIYCLSSKVVDVVFLLLKKINFLHLQGREPFHLDKICWS